MIETAQALDNLDAILSVEGLDAIWHRAVGPVAGARLPAGVRRRWIRRWRRRSSTSWRARRRIGWWRASTTACRGGAGAHRQRAFFATVSSDARRWPPARSAVLAAMQRGLGSRQRAPGHLAGRRLARCAGIHPTRVPGL